MNSISVQNIAAHGQYIQTASLLGAPPFQETRQLDWNEGLHFDRLRAEYGAWLINRNGRSVLNDGFWAAWLCGRMRLFFDQDSDVFRTTLLPITQANRISADALIEPVRLLLVEAAKQLPAFPTNELRDVRVRHLIEIMKVVPMSEAFSRVQRPVQGAGLQ